MEKRKLLLKEGQTVNVEVMVELEKSQFGNYCSNNLAKKEHQCILKPVGESLMTQSIFT